MILDSSAIVAVVRNERERTSFLQAMKDAARLSVGAPTVLESSMLLGPGSVDSMRAMFFGLGVEEVQFTSEHTTVAHTAFERFGKGRGHRAQLNFGDCLSYALAKVAGDSLLFKGEDFTHTDIEAAWLPAR